MWRGKFFIYFFESNIQLMNKQELKIFDSFLFLFIKKGEYFFPLLNKYRIQLFLHDRNREHDFNLEETIEVWMKIILIWRITFFTVEFIPAKILTILLIFCCYRQGAFILPTKLVGHTWLGALGSTLCPLLSYQHLPFSTYIYIHSKLKLSTTDY